ARQRFGTPTPMGAGEREQRGGGPPSGFRQPVTAPPSGGTGEARGGRDRAQGAYGQPPPPQSGGAGGARAQRERMQGAQAQPEQKQQPQRRQQGAAPASADHGQGHGQPEGGNKRQPKGTPPPRPQ